ncbi:MAG: hypothetical protein AB7O43_09295 [Hyphomicrobiaceae bacterium]
MLKLRRTQSFTVSNVESARMHRRLTSFSHADRIAGVTSFGSSSAHAAPLKAVSAAANIMARADMFT